MSETISRPTHAHHDDDHGQGDHHHDEGDTYFIDQLCMVGLSGAFGAICLCLWFWQTKMLNLMLGDQFHLWVLISGIVLVLIAITRAVILWFQSRDPAFLHAHGHPHNHTHDHSHAHDPAHSHEHHIQEKPPVIQAIQSAPTHVHGPGCAHEHAPGQVCDHEHADEGLLHAKQAHQDHGHAGHAHPAAPAHVMDHAHGPLDHDEADHDHGWAPWRYVVILIPIILFLLGLPNKAPTVVGFHTRTITFEYEQLFLAFTSIVYEALPFIVLGVLIAGLLEEFVPQQAIAKIIPRNRALAILLGGVLGLVFPMCECGIIVVMKRLLRKGLPLSVCVAYMLAGPVINVIVMTSTYVAFNPPQEQDYILGGPLYVVAWRVGLSYLIAFTTALLVDWQWNRHGRKLLNPSVMRGLDRAVAYDESSSAARPWKERISNITQTALNDFVDIMAFLIMGAVLAAGGKYLMKQGNIQDLFQQTPAIAILIMMAIAVLFCLCSEADAFVAANFPLYWPPASKLAFLVLGPMLDLKLYLMYTRVFRTRLIITIISSVVTQVFLYTMIIASFDDTPLPRSTEDVILSPEAELHLHSIPLGQDVYSRLALLGSSLSPPPSSGEGEPVDYKTLEAMANSADLRSQWKDRVIRVRGQFAPRSGSRQVFNLVRLKIQCCANDAVQLNVPIVARQSIDHVHINDWVNVTGKIDFRKFNESFVTVVMVSSAADVVKCDPDPNPYIK